MKIQEELDTIANSPTQFVGNWMMKTLDGGWSQARTLKADGTFTTEKKDENSGSWKIEKGALVLSSPGGGYERFDLPLKQGKLTGISHTGTKYILGKEK